MKLNCYKCSTTLEIDQRNAIARDEECPKCYSNIRSCKMCEFHDTTAYNECRETGAERILDKEKSNFCDHYKLGAGDSYKDKKDDLKSMADALFKK